MKPLLFFIACLLLLLITAVLVIESSAEETAVIAGWNILGFEPIPAARVPRIAKVIRKINPDLIVLTEVQPNAVVADIVQELGAGYQPPVILPQKETVIQNIAFVFKTGVHVTDAQLLAGTDLAEEERSRQALMAKVRIGSFDFVLIGVHLKSGRAPADRNKRTRQCQALAAFISQATTGSEKDVLVVGDYNMIPRHGQQRNDEVNF